MESRGSAGTPWSIPGSGRRGTGRLRDSGRPRERILDVGGNQRPSLGRRVRQDLVVGEPDQGWIANNRNDVVALGAELLSDVVRKHLVQQQRLAHGLPGQKLVLTQPGLLGGFLSRVGGGDLRIDLAWVGRPVADRGGYQA